MIIFLAILACSEEEKFDNNDLDDTASSTVEDTVEDTSEDTGGDTSQPFTPALGHWTYSGGELVPAGTTCILGAEETDMTDPVGFAMVARDDGFSMISDDTGSQPVNCNLDNPESAEPGSFFCANTTTSVMIEDVWEDEWGNAADIQMQIDSSSLGFFGSDETMTTTFTLTLTCQDVIFWLGGSCSDVQAEYPTPCTIQFNANATFDTPDE
jgi:hypothetical protein